MFRRPCSAARIRPTWTGGDPRAGAWGKGEQGAARTPARTDAQRFLGAADAGSGSRAARAGAARIGAFRAREVAMTDQGVSDHFRQLFAGAREVMRPLV